MRRLLQVLGLVILLATASIFAPSGDGGLRAANAADAAVAPERVPENSDLVAEYVEYRFLPDLGQITIADGVVRGERPVKRLSANARQLAGQGIFPCTDTSRARSFRRTDELGGHTFLTVVTLIPPAEGEEEWTRRATVHVDGRKKVDCSIGNSPDGEVFVYGVTLFPEDGTVQVAAVGSDGVELFPPEELERLDNPGLITDDVLEPMADEPDDQPRIERA